MTSYFKNIFSACVCVIFFSCFWSYMLGNNQFIEAQVALVWQEYLLTFGNHFVWRTALAPT